MAKALIVSAGNNANEYLARHIGELGYTRPTIVASGGEARRRMDSNDFEVVIINTPLPDEFGHELGTAAVEKTDAGVILLAKTGTAEHTDKGDDAWFVCYAPYDDPKYVVATVIEQGGGGSAVAAPVGAKVMEAVMAADAGSNDASSMGRIAGSSGRQIEGFSTKSASRSD